MTEFRFRSISWERIDVTWPNFAYALILIRSRLGLLRVNFRKIITELWPLIDVRISFPLKYLENESMGPIFAYVLILTSSRLGLLGINFQKFIKELWPLIDVRIRFHSIAWEQSDEVWPYFAHALIMTRSRLGLLRVYFHKFIKELRPLIEVRILFSAQYLENKLMKFDKILHMHW